MAEYIDRTMEISFGRVQQGWQCPICNRVYSPTTMMCMYCGNTEYKTTTTSTDDWHCADFEKRGSENGSN